MYHRDHRRLVAQATYRRARDGVRIVGEGDEERGKSVSAHPCRPMKFTYSIVVGAVARLRLRLRYFAGKNDDVLVPRRKFSHRLVVSRGTICN